VRLPGTLLSIPMRLETYAGADMDRLLLDRIRTPMKTTQAVFGINSIRLGLLGWVSASWILTLLLVLTLPAVVKAQFSYSVNNGAVTISGYTGSSRAVNIPSTINRLPVTAIGESAFAGCSSLTSMQCAKPFKWRKPAAKGSQLRNSILTLCN